MLFRSPVQRDRRWIREHVTHVRQIQPAQLAAPPHAIEEPMSDLRGSNVRRVDHLGGRGIEDVVVPALRFCEFLVAVEVVGNQERDMEKGFAVIG